jgi:hypothetical protein
MIRNLKKHNDKIVALIERYCKKKLVFARPLLPFGTIREATAQIAHLVFPAHMPLRKTKKPEVKDFDELLPEYLYLYFQRTEFDRYARFNSWGSARETFDWADMCDVKLPISSIEKQEAIVTIYHTLETRKRINEQLKESIKPLCPVLMKGVVESMEVETVES